jgi:hypothetical protein
LERVHTPERGEANNGFGTVSGDNQDEYLNATAQTLWHEFPAIENSINEIYEEYQDIIQYYST